MNFNMEEMNLMCVYNTGSRTSLMTDIKESMPDVYDAELREIMEQVISKLESLTDEEFSQITFYPDFGDEIEEQEE